MRDAMGGLVNIVIIVVFMVIVSGYLAFNVNYTKAFRVKNKIITVYEQYEGNCESNSSQCMTEITEYMKKLGYNQRNLPSESQLNRTYPNYDWTCRTGYGFCVGEKEIENVDSSSVQENRKTNFKIVTQITIDIPIINKVMAGLNTFQVTGDTKAITVRVR